MVIMDALARHIGDHQEPTPQQRRGPGRGVGQKRLVAERLAELDVFFFQFMGVHRFSGMEGYRIINESGTMVAAQIHQNLDDLCG
ncbi:MAG: hypothetical protein ACFFDP_10815 [Promethearchaeota archaeon]